MGRQASHSVHVNGRTVSYGLVPRKGYWRVRLGKEHDRTELATGCKTKARARDRAAELIAGHLSGRPSTGPGWDDALGQLAGLTRLRPATRKGYGHAVTALRRVLPDLLGPADVTPAEAARFAREYAPKSANTVRWALRQLGSLWRKHWGPLGVVEGDPWAAVAPPPASRSDPRAPADADYLALLAHLRAAYPGWELLPTLVQVKAYLGCRTLDLCQLRADQFRDGVIHFAADQTKGRAGRSVPLPAELAAAVGRVRGRVWLWDRFADEAPRFRPSRSRPGPRAFDPSWLYNALTDVFRDFNKDRAPHERVRPHDLRRRALTEAAQKFGVDMAARAVGVDPATARRYYVDAERAFDVGRVYGGMEGWKGGPPIGPPNPVRSDDVPGSPGKSKSGESGRNGTNRRKS